jgi:hypothetical protein
VDESLRLQMGLGFSALILEMGFTSNQNSAPSIASRIPIEQFLSTIGLLKKTVEFVLF